MKNNPQNLQAGLKPEDFLPAAAEEKQNLIIMREPVSFSREGLNKLKENKVAMASFTIILLIAAVSLIIPMFYPYTYDQQIKGANNLKPFEYSERESELIAQGENIFPHIFGTDSLGRDYAVRVMIGGRISLAVGLVATAIILVVGTAIGSVAALMGGWVDMIIMRIVDIIYTLPDVLVIILLSFVINEPLTRVAEQPAMGWMRVVGPNIISIFTVFGLLYWVGMARMVRSRILVLKESEYVTAARALGAKNGRIIIRHLLPNCMGTLIVTTTLQIPSSIFTESFLSFLGMGVAVPLPSLGSLASDGINSLATSPHLLMIPAVAISLIILSFNLLGDGLRDAFDPQLRSR